MLRQGLEELITPERRRARRMPRPTPEKHIARLWPRRAGGAYLGFDIDESRRGGR
jgi:hypothetical protein